MKTLYITDLDGTLLNDNALISKKSKKMISSLINNGALFTVATARTFATVTEMFKDIELKLPLALMNGVMLYDPSDKKIMSYHTIKPKAVSKVLEIFSAHKIYPLVYRCRDIYLEIEYYNKDNPYQMKYIGNRTEVNGKKFIFSPLFSVEEKSDVIYVVSLDKYENLLPVYNEISSLNEVSCAFYSDNYTGCYFLEIFAEGVSKASALKEIKSIVGAEKVIAFGDNLNDMAMFYESDKAYAVENACDELKQIATDVIGKNTENAVAEFIFKDFGEFLNE